MKRTFILLFTLACMQPVFAQQPEGCPDPALKTLPVLWQQTSAEYRALCYQAFNLATMRLDQIPAKTYKEKKLAIITDLDETIIDNSRNDAQLVIDNDSYSPQNWKRWTDLSEASAVPGAVEFLQDAHKRGVSIFYISNRDTAAIQSTLTNLKKLNLPNADRAHMLFLSKSSSKDDRRKKVMEGYEVIMLMGDNLGDFAGVFDKKPYEERLLETDRVKDEWGRKFIVLPNATYGEWENALYDYDRTLNQEQRYEKRKEKMKGF